MSKLTRATAMVLMTLAVAGAGAGTAQAGGRDCVDGTKGENWVCVDGKRMSDGRYEKMNDDKGND